MFSCTSYMEMNVVLMIVAVLEVVTIGHVRVVIIAETHHCSDTSSLLHAVCGFNEVIYHI